MIIVTGASRGIGRSICDRLLQNKAEVLGISKTKAKVDFNCVTCDVSSYESIRAVSNHLKSAGKRVSGVINAAGIASMNLAITTPPSVTKHIIDVNLLGTIFCCQLFAPLMLRSGGGSIINFSTIAVPLGLKGESVYIASKAGVEGFSRAFAREMASLNVRVNCIAPGPINTRLLKGVSDTQINTIISRQVIPTRFNPIDVADLVDLLLDYRAHSISGQVLHVGGV